MFKTPEDLGIYLFENFEEVTDRRVNDSHWDIHCPTCNVTRGFQVVDTAENLIPDPEYGKFHEDFTLPFTKIFRCPVCTGYKHWIMYRTVSYVDQPGKANKRVIHYFKVASVPNDGTEEIDELPAEPKALRMAYQQAIRAMGANAHIASAAMFRRALQVITRDVLRAKPGNLADELKDVLGKTFDGATIGNDFSSVGYIIKEAGNQGAHPDKDQDLLEFTQLDSKDLHDIFMELVTELFVLPTAKKKAREDFLSRRKITPKKTT